MHGYYLAEIKKPSEVKQGWDVLNILNEVPADQGTRVAATGSIDPDDVRPHIGEQHRGERRRPDAGKLDHANSF